MSLTVADVAQGALIHDEESGLVYDRKRMLDTATGRMNQRDSLSYIDGLNLYQYVRSNPIDGTDPFGTAWSKEKPKIPCGCSGVNIKCDADWNFKFGAIIVGGGVSSFSATGSDGKCIYRIKGKGDALNDLTTQNNQGGTQAAGGTGIGYFSNSFADHDKVAVLWPVSVGDVMYAQTWGVGGSLWIPVSLSRTVSKLGDNFYDSGWLNQGGANVFAGSVMIEAKVSEVEYDVH